MAEVCGDAARLTRPGAPEELGDAIAELLDDGKEAGRLREAGLTRASTFTWESATTNHILAYREAMQQAR
jgi:glycosyltransferase involved in cell wall biosynthesis